MLKPLEMEFEWLSVQLYIPIGQESTMQVVTSL